jgi:hypothetical protein
MSYLPPPPTHKTIQKVIAVKDSFSSELERHLTDGWKIVNAVAQHGGGDSSLFGYVYFILEKWVKL